MLEEILGLLFDLFGELLLQLLFELLAEFGMRWLGTLIASDRKVSPASRFFGYALLGVAFGFVSLAFQPRHLLRTEHGRILNYIFTPVAVGCAMAWLGRWRSRRNQSLVGLDRFWCGWAFAFALAGVRYFLCS